MIKLPLNKDIKTYPEHQSLLDYSYDWDFSKDEIGDIVFKMQKTMKELNGVGISAPQIGINKRIILCENLLMINPQFTIRRYSSQIYDWEGCLSLPGQFYNVPRWNLIDVKFYDLNGKICHGTFNGFSARVIQHEVDHLDGKLIHSYGDEYNVINRE